MIANTDHLKFIMWQETAAVTLPPVGKKRQSRFLVLPNTGA